MEQAHLHELRKKQLLITNLVFLFYAIIAYGLIFSRVTGLVLYIVMAVIFLILPIGLLFFRVPQPLHLVFPKMRELQRYEQEKLKDVWFSYYTSSMILHIAATIFFIIQAIIRNPKLPFIEGIPIWYIIGISIILLWVGNSNQIFHTRRIDQKSYEQLKIYASDKRTFALVFAIVALTATVLAILVVTIMSREFL
jgi:hypothetical protein